MYKAVIVLLLLLPIGSALSFPGYEAYRSGETVILNLEGNPISNIDLSQFELKRGTVRVPFEGSAVLVGEKWFVWFVAPVNSGNYSLNLKNVFVRESGKQEYKNASAEFEIVENSAGYAVIPGAFVTKNDFKISIRSYLDSSTKIEVDFPTSQSLTIKPGENEFNIPVPDDLPRGVYKIKIGQYDIPLQIISEVDSIESKNKPYFAPKTIFISNINDRRKTITIYNPTEIDYENVKLIYNSDKLNVEPNEFDLLAGKSIEIILTSEEKSFIGDIALNLGNETVYLPVEINVEEIGIADNESAGFDYYCAELGGVKCKTGELCSGQVKSSIEGPCCVGVCKSSTSEKKGNGVGYIIGLLILVVIGFIIFKYRKSPKVISESKK